LNYGLPDLVLLNRMSDRPAVKHMEGQPDWVVLYQDGLAVLYGRRSIYENPESPRKFPAELRQLSDNRPVGSAAWPAFPRRSGRDAFSPERAAAVQLEVLRMSQRSVD
jgi:hypothetical protein